MAKKRKKRLTRTYIKEWRQHRGLNQTMLAERVDVAQGTISDLEGGKIAYTQPMLEAVAGALNCRAWDLIWRPPGAVDNLRDVLEGLAPDEQRRALAVVQALKDTKVA